MSTGNLLFRSKFIRFGVYAVGLVLSVLLGLTLFRPQGKSHSTSLRPDNPPYLSTPDTTLQIPGHAEASDQNHDIDPDVTKTTQEEDRAIRDEIGAFESELREVERENSRVIVHKDKITAISIKRPDAGQLHELRLAAAKISEDFVASPAAEAKAREQSSNLLERYTRFEADYKYLFVDSSRDDGLSMVAIGFTNDISKPMNSDGKTVNFHGRFETGYMAKDAPVFSRYGYLLQAGTAAGSGTAE